MLLVVVSFDYKLKSSLLVFRLTMLELTNSINPLGSVGNLLASSILLLSINSNDKSV